MTAPNLPRFFSRLDLTRPGILAALENAFDAGYTARIDDEGDLHFYDAAGNHCGYLELDPLTPTAETADEEV